VRVSCHPSQVSNSGIKRHLCLRIQPSHGVRCNWDNNPATFRLCCQDSNDVVLPPGNYCQTHREISFEAMQSCVTGIAIVVGLPLETGDVECHDQIELGQVNLDESVLPLFSLEN